MLRSKKSTPASIGFVKIIAQSNVRQKLLPRGMLYQTIPKITIAILNQGQQKLENERML